jgi:hypothetical protein
LCLKRPKVEQNEEIEDSKFTSDEPKDWTERFRLVNDEFVIEIVQDNKDYKAKTGIDQSVSGIDLSFMEDEEDNKGWIYVN